VNTRFLGIAGFALAVVLAARPSIAQVAPFTVSFNEKGNGTLTSGGTSTTITSAGNGTDPADPNNGLRPLIYNLGASTGLGVVVGDISLSEIAGGPTSDLIRFTFQGANEILVVYSDLAETGEVPDLADVGIPTFRQTNLVSLTETGPENGVNGMFGYSPTPNQPGGLPAGNTITYSFTSDVPEPAAAGLAALGATFAAGFARRRS